MKSDESQNRLHDPSLDPFSQRLAQGVDPHVSYVTTLTKTSGEIVNVQLLGGDSKELHSKGAGALIVALTDLSLLRQEKDGKSTEWQLSRIRTRSLPASCFWK